MVLIKNISESDTMKVDIYFDTPWLYKTMKNDADYCKNIVLSPDNTYPLHLHLNYKTFFESCLLLLMPKSKLKK